VNEMNNDLKNIHESRRLLRHITSEACLCYNQLCGTQSEEIVASVLDGELRMCSKLAELEAKAKGLP